MADENNAGTSGTGAEGSEGNNAASQNGAQGGTKPGAATGAIGQEPGRQQTFDAAYVRDLRAENATYRNKANDFEQKFNSSAAKVLELETQLKTKSIRTEIAIISSKGIGDNKAKLVDMDAAFALMDQKAIEFDDNGNPKNVEEILKKLIEEKPYLVQQTSGVTTNPTNPARPGSTLTREQIEKMTPAEINANWDEVQKVLAAAL